MAKVGRESSVVGGWSSGRAVTGVTGKPMGVFGTRGLLGKPLLKKQAERGGDISLALFGVDMDRNGVGRSLLCDRLR